ncbi:hypothetical protein D3C76_1407240 [compost metagenome]
MINESGDPSDSILVYLTKLPVTLFKLRRQRTIHVTHTRGYMSGCPHVARLKKRR